MIDFNLTTVPSGMADRAELLRLADLILKNMGDEAPPIEVAPERSGGPQRLWVWSTDFMKMLDIEPADIDDGLIEYGTEGLEELLDQFPLTPLQKAVAFRVLDGRRTESWSPETGWQPEKGYMIDVAEAIGITPGSAKVHWSNAKRKMRDTVMAQAS